MLSELPPRSSSRGIESLGNFKDDEISTALIKCRRHCCLIHGVHKHPNKTQ